MPESEFERNLWELRLEKLRQIGAHGVAQGLSYAEATYPNSYPITTTVGKLRAEYIDTDAPATAESLEADRVEAAIAGRVMQIRVQGKAGFAQLQGDGKRLQIYVRREDVGEAQFGIFKLLDLGDHIGVTGYLFITRTGETTLHVTSLRFLAKALLALPDKYHGLEDVELRYRQRYVDLFMNTGQSAKQAEHAPAPEVLEGGESQTGHEAAPPNVREVFEKRAKVLKAIRRFFDERGYLEVETPMMHPVAGGAAAKPFTTHHNALDMDLYLRIAPELYLKRLVVGGLDKVYEINRNFRNEGISTQHNPEFTMLEFYQAYANYEDLMELTQHLVTRVAEDVNASTICEFDGQKIDLGIWKRLSMRDAIVAFWPLEGGSPPQSEDLVDIQRFGSFIDHARTTALRKNQTENSTEAALVSMTLQNIRWRWESTASLGECIAELFEQVAERHLIQPTIIYDFPCSVSPLSKPKPDEPDWVERFEFYIGGFEIGNAFSELNDPVDQRERFEAQVAAKAKGDDEAHEMDEDYVRALSYGLPPTAGEGIGIDRLVMILTGQRSIRDVILFPLLRPQAKAEAE